VLVSLADLKRGAMRQASSASSRNIECARRIFDERGHCWRPPGTRFTVWHEAGSVVRAIIFRNLGGLRGFSPRRRWRSGHLPSAVKGLGFDGDLLAGGARRRSQSADGE